MNQILVRDGKGAKDRVTILPAVAKGALAQHLQAVKRQPEADLTGAPAGSSCLGPSPESTRTPAASGHTAMDVPIELVPAVRELIAKRRESPLDPHTRL